MGFFDEYKEASGAYIGEVEKGKLITDGTPLKVTLVRRELSQFPKTEPGPNGKQVPVVDENGNVVMKERFVVGVELDGEPRRLSFDVGVGGRDDLLTAMAAYLEDEDAEPPTVRLEKLGRAIMIRGVREEASSF